MKTKRKMPIGELLGKMFLITSVIVETTLLGLIIYDWDKYGEIAFVTSLIVIVIDVVLFKQK